MFQGGRAEAEAARWQTVSQTPKTAVKKSVDSHRYAPPASIGTMSIVGSDEVGTGDFFGPMTVVAVYVDAKQIERSIYNLLLNACQAARSSGSKPEVVATLELSGFDIVLNVSDNGLGIPSSIREDLFAPFVSAGKQKGTGLGLTIASAISVEHGGQVTLVRSCAGETVFQMRIPREATTVIAQPTPRGEVIAG